MAIELGLKLGSEVGVRVIAKAWVRVRLWVVVCRDIAQFLTILHIVRTPALACGRAGEQWQRGGQPGTLSLLPPMWPMQ